MLSLLLYIVFCLFVIRLIRSVLLRQRREMQPVDKIKEKYGRKENEAVCSMCFYVHSGNHTGRHRSGAGPFMGLRHVWIIKCASSIVPKALRMKRETKQDESRDDSFLCTPRTVSFFNQGGATDRCLSSLHLSLLDAMPREAPGSAPLPLLTILHLPLPRCCPFPSSASLKPTATNNANTRCSIIRSGYIAFRSTSTERHTIDRQKRRSTTTLPKHNLGVGLFSFVLVHHEHTAKLTARERERVQLKEALTRTPTQSAEKTSCVGTTV
jgi:hypothetical protein